MDGSDLKRRAESDQPDDTLSESTNSKRAKVSPAPANTPDAPAPATKPAPAAGLDEEEPEIVTTAEDLIYDLGGILKPLPAERRAFAALKTLDGVPMPGLEILGAGGVGLALSARDADAIKACAADILRGMPVKLDLPAIPTSWELPASSVAFRNRAWASYIHQTVRTAACTLLSTQSMTTDINLEKLVLHGASPAASTFVVAEERKPLVYAYVAVALPSSWAGGDLKVSLGSESVEYCQSNNSEFGMSAATWHADTVHSISPITTGHRLTLLYSLSHNSSVDPIPTVLDTTEQEASLAETLSDWLKALSSHAATLEKAVILLSTRAPATFDDAHRRRRDQGRPRAPRCGCTWVTIEKTGPGNDCGCAEEVAERNADREDRRDNMGCGRGRWDYGYDEDEEEEVSEDEELEDVCGCTFSITDESSTDSSAALSSLSGVNGAKYQVALFPIALDELVPGPPFDERADSNHFDRNALAVTLTYTRQALVLWPATSTDAILLSCLGAVSLSERLQVSLSQLATLALPDQAAERRRVSDIARAICSSGNASGSNADVWVPAVLEASLVLKDAVIFGKLAQAAKGRLQRSTVATAAIARAVDTFGVIAVLPLLKETLVRPAPVAVPAYPGAVAAPTPRAFELGSIAIQELVSASPALLAHAGKLYTVILSTAKVEPSEATSVASLVATLGAATFERDVLPFVEVQTGAGFQIALAQAFRVEAARTLGGDAATCLRLAERILSLQVDAYQPMLPPAVNLYAYGHYGAQKKPSVGEAWELIALALNANRNDLLKRVLDKVLAPTAPTHISQALQPFLPVRSFR